MADTKLSGLTAASALDGTELVYGAQGGNSRKITTAQVKTLTSASPTLVTPNLGTPSAGVLTNCTGYVFPSVAFASLPSAASSTGLTYSVTDAGNALFRSDGTIWKPTTGVAVLITTAIPMVLAPTGVMANNGAITLGTALGSIFANCYLYLPASAISVGSAAGLYYTVMSSTTVGVVYNNTYTSGQPTIPASPTAFVTTGPGAYVQTISTDIALITVTVPGGMLGINGELVQRSLYGYNNSAGTKTMRHRYGGTGAISATGTTSAATRLFSAIQNMGIATTQMFQGSAIPVAGSGTAIAPIVVNSATDQAFTFNAQLAVATDFVVLGSAFLQLVLP